jgi:hypothetical protein
VAVIATGDAFLKGRDFAAWLGWVSCLDAWGAAEWYQGDWTVRGGLFDLTFTPAGGNSPAGGDLDPTSNQFQIVGETERRYRLWDRPGAIISGH